MMAPTSTVSQTLVFKFVIGLSMLTRLTTQNQSGPLVNTCLVQRHPSIPMALESQISTVGVEQNASLRQKLDECLGDIPRMRSRFTFFGFSTAFDFCWEPVCFTGCFTDIYVFIPQILKDRNLLNMLHCYCYIFLHYKAMLLAFTSRLATVVDRLDARHTWRQQRAAAMEEAGAMGIYESCVSVLPDFSQVGGFQ